MAVFDFKKEYKELYQGTGEPSILNVSLSKACGGSTRKNSREKSSAEKMISGGL